VKLDFLKARLRPVEQLDTDVEIGCRSSRMCQWLIWNVYIRQDPLCGTLLNSPNNWRAFSWG